MPLSYRNLFCCLAIWLMASPLSTHAQGELKSSVLLNSYTATEVQDMLTELGIPPLFVFAQYDVDIYRIRYLTPYRHPDSLVLASGMVVVPRETEEALPCGLPLVSYGHGTAAAYTDVPSYNLEDAQALVNIAFSSTGYCCVAPDYLGLGDYDPKVLIHPYQHGFSQANTSINMLRATRHFLDSLGVGLSGQVYLHGYSQGGFTTVAALREMQTVYPEEFNVIASAPMSGAYDMGGAQADLIGSDDPYPTPGYLPFIILAYQDQYGGTLFTNISDILVPPFDATLPDIFYSKTTGIGTINGICTPVPKDMIQDTVITNFYADPEHRFRRLLAENDMLEWAPQSPVRLLYCQGDDQVSYLNSERAYDRWNELGAPSVTKMDFGSYNHNDCALFCFLDAKEFFDSFEKCTPDGLAETAAAAQHLFPNPAGEYTVLQVPETWIGRSYQIRDVQGGVVQRGQLVGRNTTLSLSVLTPGMYILQVEGQPGLKLIRQ